MPFDCKDSDLNEFLSNDSKNYLSKLLSVTYVIEYNDVIIAFFSVSNDKITAEDVKDEKLFKKIFKRKMPYRKQFSSYPAVKIGRLGVHHAYQNCGFGGQLLDFIKGLFITNNRTGCQYITVDAYKQSLRFYEKNGFKYLTEEDKDRDTRQMYFSLVDLV